MDFISCGEFLLGIFHISRLDFFVWCDFCFFCSGGLELLPCYPSGGRFFRDDSFRSDFVCLSLRPFKETMKHVCGHKVAHLDSANIKFHHFESFATQFWFLMWVKLETGVLAKFPKRTCFWRPLDGPPCTFFWGFSVACIFACNFSERKIACFARNYNGASMFRMAILKNNLHIAQSIKNFGALRAWLP